MYGLGDLEVWRLHREEISRQVREARAGRTRQSRLMDDLGWELARLGGLFRKRLGSK